MSGIPPEPAESSAPCATDDRSDKAAGEPSEDSLPEEWSDDTEGAPAGEPVWELGPPPMFAHPEWAVGLVLVIALVMLTLGILAHPLWLLLGSPFILTLGVWIFVRIVQWRRRRGTGGAEDSDLA